jgi:putative ABC transport system permease protein
MWQDVRVAWRFLLKRRTSTVIAALTLGMAVAVCTMAAGVVDQAFWRSLEVDGGGELLTVYNRRAAAPQFQTLSYRDYVDLRDRMSDVADAAAFMRIDSTFGGGDWPVRVLGELVSDNYFAVLAARPYAGRLLAPATGALSRDPVVVLSYRFWRRTFNGDPAVIGRPLRLGRSDYIVAGIAPDGFHGPAYPSDFWVPLGMAAELIGPDLLSRPEVPFLQTVVRPRATTIPQLQSRVEGLETYASADGWRLAVLPAAYLKFWPAYRSAVARYLAIFAALGACILIIACANLAGLLMARAGERQRELALRQALGATRRQLVRRLAAESLVLGALGGTIGLLLISCGAGFVTRIPTPVPAPLGMTFDVRLGVVCLIVSLGASLLFTAMSAVKGLRANMRSVLGSSSAAVTERPRAQRVLVVAQVALCSVLMTVAGLLGRTAMNVDRIDVGFDVANHLTGTVGLRDQGYTVITGSRFYARLQEELSRRSEVEAVAFGWNAPLTPIRSTAAFAISGSAQSVQARYNVVSAGYFRALGIPLVAGREFEASDTSASEPVAIVNETLATRFSGGAVGRTVTLAQEPLPRRIIGVAREIKYNGLTEPAQPFVYLPLPQAFRADMQVHLRTRGAAGAAILREAVRSLDANVALSNVRTFTEQLDEARAVPHASAVFSTVAAGLAVFLALVGVYGVLATSVQRRTKELAIRTALGARPAEIIRLIAFEGAGLTGLGLLIGVLVSIGAGRFVADLLFGVDPRDGLVFALAPACVFAASAASWIAPARRAATADPVSILRSE